MDDTQQFSTEELKSLFDQRTLGTLVYNELVSEIEAKELERVSEEIGELVQLNMQLGGSEFGYYYNNVLFTNVASYNLGEISPINEELEHRANGVKLNQQELGQDMHYFGNFLSVCRDMTDSLPVFMANIPQEFFNFSDSLTRLRNLCNREQGETWEDDLKYRAGQPAFDNYYLHVQRIEPKIQRYLLRKVTA